MRFMHIFRFFPRPCKVSNVLWFTFRELFGGVNTGINFDKYDDIPIDITGDDVPQPISKVGFR